MFKSEKFEPKSVSLFLWFELRSFKYYLGGSNQMSLTAWKHTERNRQI